MNKKTPGVKSIIRPKEETDAIKDAAAKLQRSASPLDGFSRTSDEERELNQLLARTFRGKAGTETLAYLRKITIDTIAGPEVSDQHLRHLEGSRYIVGVIQARIDRGRNQK